MEDPSSQRGQVSGGRFSDWTSRDVAGREKSEAECRARLGTVGAALKAVARVLPKAERRAGSLSGTPYVVKDMVTNGHAPASWGCSTALDDRIAAAAVVDRLNASGARLIAAAEMTVLAYEPSGVNEVRGSVLNPWNSEFVPGGSSSGSAALVAAGCCDMALGSDTGGSVRIPAHCCGVTALKPSWGSVSTDGTMPLAPSLDTIGILARSAIDIIPGWFVLSGQPADAARGITTAAVIEGALTECDSAIVAMFTDAVAAIARLDISICTSHGFPQSADRAALLVMQAEAARTHRSRLASTAVDEVLRKRLSKGLDITDAELEATLRRRGAAREEFELQCLGDADVALLPVMPLTTPRYDETDPSKPTFNPRKLYAMSRFTRFVNFLGLPALALPMGFDGNGMPAAMQIVGRLGSEASLLNLARCFQDETSWHGRVPDSIARDVAETCRTPAATTMR